MRRGQVTIFIIIGIILIGSTGLVILWKSGILPNFSGSKEINPNLFISMCLEEKVKDTLEIISLQGGYIENKLNKTFQFDNEIARDISYLCYNQNYYLPCINQEPMLIQHLKKEIKNKIAEDVENCFDELKLSLEKQRYEVESEYNGFEIDLAQKKIIINIDGKMIISKSGETSINKNFDFIIPSRFYDLAIVVQEIVSQEARFCNFEYLGFMLAYPNFEIDRFKTGDSTIIYTIQHRDSLEKFRFAVRGCVIPPGI